MIGTGIGIGSSNPFNPKTPSGLIAWYRADLGVTTSGANVSKWADQSGNGRDLTGVSNEAQVSPTGAPNSLPALSFAAHGALATATPLITGTDAARTYAIVCQSSDTADLMGFFFDGSLSANGIGYVINDTAASKRNLYIPAGVAADTTSNHGSSFELIVIQNHGTGATNGNQTLFVNGTQHTLDLSNKSLVAATSAFFMGGLRASSGFFVNGLIAEFMAYSRALSSTELTELHDYIFSRYGI